MSVDGRDRAASGAGGPAIGPPTATMTEGLALDLREEWRGLLERRPALAESLGVYGDVLERWARGAAARGPARLGRGAGAEALGTGRAAARPRRRSRCRPRGVEALLGPRMECLAALGAEDAAALQRFAEGVGPRRRRARRSSSPYRGDGRSPRAEVGLRAGCPVIPRLREPAAHPRDAVRRRAARTSAMGSGSAGSVPSAGRRPASPTSRRTAGGASPATSAGARGSSRASAARSAAMTARRTSRGLEAEAREEGYSVVGLQGVPGIREGAGPARALERRARPRRGLGLAPLRSRRPPRGVLEAAHASARARPPRLTAGCHRGRADSRHPLGESQHVFVHASSVAERRLRALVAGRPGSRGCQAGPQP